MRRESLLAKKLLSFDLSLSNSGWAVFIVKDRKIKLKAYGAIGTKRFAQRSTGMRLDYISKEIRKIYKEHKPDIVVKERSFSNFRITATQQIFKVNGVWEHMTFLADQEDFTELTPSEVKKYVTGNGKAKKPEVTKAVNEYFDLNLKAVDNDIADAIAVGLAHCMKEGLIDE